MGKIKKNRSFATRLSQWVMLVLFIMMLALAFLIFTFADTLLEEIGGETVHTNIVSSERHIQDFMSDVKVAVDNNLVDIERSLNQPDQMQNTVERMVKQNPRIRSCGISFIDNYYPQKGHHFCPYAWRTDSMEIKTTQLGEISEDYLKSDWFMKSVAKDSAYWSDPFIDGHDAKTPLVAYLQPIHDKQGKVVAILGADLSLDFMTDFLQKQDSIFEDVMWMMGTNSKDKMNVSRSYILSRDGTYITHPDSWRILKGNFFKYIKDTDKKGAAKEIIKKMKEGKKSSNETYETIRINARTSYLFYAPVKGTDWILAVSVPVLTIDLLGYVLGIIMVFIVCFILQVTFFVCRFVIKRTAKPLVQLADAADKVAQGKFDTPLPTIKHNDEIHQLRDSFENMQQSLATYVEELKSTTAAKASIENELEIAHGIQMSMLPKAFPAYPNRKDIDVYGQVTPAKAVGGDLYDFFIRDEKLFFCIGDVSGKGVPASLVMAVSRSLFRNIAAHTAKPDEIVTALNEALSNNNESGMFVTLFVGALDLQTGHLNYSNAGHDMPLLLTDEEVIILPCDPNIPAGVENDWKFTCQEVDMKACYTLFLYTDGLNEAEDIEHNQFTLERIVETATSADRCPKQLIRTMKDAVGQLVGEADQSDDMTLFAIQYKNTLTNNYTTTKMINDNAIFLELIIIFAGIIVIMASIGIPIYAYSRKRWKGLVLGLLLQPIVCAVVIFSIALGAFFYFENANKKEMESAMVTVRGIDVGRQIGDTLTWYLKADEECILVCNDDKDYNEIDYCDVIRLDSVSVGVEDRIVVKFDMKNKKVTATDLGSPMKVVSVNWEDAKTYFSK